MNLGGNWIKYVTKMTFNLKVHLWNLIFPKNNFRSCDLFWGQTEVKVIHKKKQDSPINCKISVNRYFFILNIFVYMASLDLILSCLFYCYSNFHQNVWFSCCWFLEIHQFCINCDFFTFFQYVRYRIKSSSKLILVYFYALFPFINTAQS